MSEKAFPVKHIFILIALLIVLSLLLMRLQNKREVKKVAKPKVYILKIKDKPIYADEFERLFMDRNSELGQLKDKYYINVLKKEFAYKLADEILLAGFALKSGIHVSNEEILEELNAMKEGYTKTSFDEMLKSEGLTVASLKESTRQRLILKKVLKEKIYNEIEVSDDEIVDFYDQFKSSFYEPEGYKIEKITVEDEARAKEVYGRLLSKEIDFDTAVEEYSILMESLDVEEREYIPKSGLPEEFESALEELKPGEMTPIINTAKGYHIILLQDKKEGHLSPIKEVKDKIKRILTEKKEKMAYSSFIRNLKKENEVILNEDYFKVVENEE